MTTAPNWEQAADLLRSIRTAGGYTQTDFAELCGVSLPTYSRLERATSNDPPNPTSRSVISVAFHLGHDDGAAFLRLVGWDDDQVARARFRTAPAAAIPADVRHAVRVLTDWLEQRGEG